MMKVAEDSIQVIFYPFRAGNKYVELNKKVLISTGCEVLDIRDTFNPRNMFKRKKRVAVINWLEDRPYAMHLPEWAVPLQYLKCLLLILLFKLFASKTIWITHNFKPHNRHRSSFYHSSLCKILRHLSHRQVALETYPIETSTQHYVAHPIYEINTTQLKQIEADKNGSHRDILVGFYGVIKPYKNLHNILEVWPDTIELTIHGLCANKDYEEILLEIIHRRKLHVDYKNTFLTNDHLDAMLLKTRFVLLPHEDGSMVSSGMFYHGISLGCNILVNPSRFGSHKAKQHDFVNFFDANECSVDFLQSRYINSLTVRASAQHHYSHDVVAGQWQALIKSVFQ